MTLVPCPALSCCFGSEIGPSHVHDAGGEAQQASVAIRPIHPGSRRGQTVLLIGTGQQVEGSVFQVGCLLDQLGIQNEVRCRWSRSDVRGFVRIQPDLEPMKKTGSYRKTARPTVWTADPSCLSSTSSRTMDMVVAATLLNWKFCAHTVSSTENHISCIWVTGPVPGLLAKEGGGVADIESLSGFLSISSIIAHCPPLWIQGLWIWICLHGFICLNICLFVPSSITQTLLIGFWQILKEWCLWTLTNYFRDGIVTLFVHSGHHAHHFRHW